MTDTARTEAEIVDFQMLAATADYLCYGKYCDKRAANNLRAAIKLMRQHGLHDATALPIPVETDQQCSTEAESVTKLEAAIISESKKRWPPTSYIDWTIFPPHARAPHFGVFCKHALEAQLAQREEPIAETCSHCHGQPPVNAFGLCGECSRMLSEFVQRQFAAEARTRVAES